MDDDDSRKDASEWIKDLGEVYRAYMLAQEDGTNKKRGIASLFKRWFSGFDPLAVQPVHQAFLDEVGRIVSELAAALESIRNERSEMSAAYANKALDIMLMPKPSRNKTTAEWYLTICEYQSAILLPYASLEKLQSVRNEMLRQTPKRLMLPKQRELIESMERLINKDI